MGRIVSLVLGLVFSCLLVTGLLSRTDGFALNIPTDAAAQIPPLSATTEPLSSLEVMQLPAPIPGTGLIAERMVSYEGPFIEDGSDTPVANVAALVIRNAGECGIEEATVVVERAGERYEFNLTYILPGMSVMVLEATAAPYFRDGITGISGWESVIDKNSNSISCLQLEAVDMGHVAVTNRTSDTMENIILYHKNYLPDGTFVGGITYQTPIGTLEPGQTETVFPEHYADGYSKIFYAEQS